MVLGGILPGNSTNVAATDSSVAGTLTPKGGHNACHICNPSATLAVAVRIGESAAAAVLTTDIKIPPLGQVVIAMTTKDVHCAAIGSAAGPTAVVFTPCTVR